MSIVQKLVIFFKKEYHQSYESEGCHYLLEQHDKIIMINAPSCGAKCNEL